jgi:hypothetical protein
LAISSRKGFWVCISYSERTTGPPKVLIWLQRGESEELLL